MWVEKYRPTALDDYVFKDAYHREQIEQFITDGSIPHLLFSGSAGVGKTTMAKILINQLGVSEFDVLYANGSKEARKIEWVDKLIAFCNTMPFGDYKIVLIDEADYMNIQSVQPALRNLMEENSQSVRFILTCNYPHRILDAIHSRCQSFHIEKMDLREFTARAATILFEENVEFDLDTLDTYVQSKYPDLRKCINLLQGNSIGGKLKTIDESDTSSSEYKPKMVELFKAGKMIEARKLICANAQPEDMVEIYTWLYKNVELVADTVEKQDTAILYIKQALVDHAICADAEINMAACLIRLSRI